MHFFPDLDLCSLSCSCVCINFPSSDSKVWMSLHQLLTFRSIQVLNFCYKRAQKCIFYNLTFGWSLLKIKPKQWNTLLIVPRNLQLLSVLVRPWWNLLWSIKLACNENLQFLVENSVLKQVMLCILEPPHQFYSEVSMRLRQINATNSLIQTDIQNLEEALILYILWKTGDFTPIYTLTFSTPPSNKLR